MRSMTAIRGRMQRLWRRYDLSGGVVEDRQIIITVCDFPLNGNQLMEQPVKKPRIWILVADGSRARIVRYDANGKHSDDLVFEADHKQLKEIMADKPGRSFASMGAKRSAMEYHSDPVRAGALCGPEPREGEARFFRGTFRHRHDRRYSGPVFRVGGPSVNGTAAAP